MLSLQSHCTYFPFFLTSTTTQFFLACPPTQFPSCFNLLIAYKSHVACFAQTILEYTKKRGKNNDNIVEGTRLLLNAYLNAFYVLFMSHISLFTLTYQMLLCSIILY